MCACYISQYVDVRIDHVVVLDIMSGQAGFSSSAAIMTPGRVIEVIRLFVEC